MPEQGILLLADITRSAIHSSTTDEAALSSIVVLQRIARSEVSVHGGRLLKRTGYAVLAQFDEVAPAVLTAIGLRDAIDPKLR